MKSGPVSRSLAAQKLVWTAHVRPRFAYVNGRYLSRRDASVNIEDRGYQFADGVYELCEVREGRLIDERRHIERLRRSLNELKIAWPLAPSAPER